MKPEDLPRIAYDPAVFEAFYRENVEAIQRFIARRVADPHLVADLTADVFLAAVDSADTYRSDKGEPRAWLYGVARVLVLAEMRRSAREWRTARAIEGRGLLDADDIVRMQERIDAEAHARALVDNLSRLPEGERAVLELVAMDGLRVAEAASALGIRPVTARVRLHRARTALRRELSAQILPTTDRPMEVSP